MLLILSGEKGMDIIVVFKLITMPIAIFITVLIAKKWGNFVGGFLAGLPTFSGPISFFITYEQGPDFAYLASYNSLIGLLGCASTAIVYSWTAYFGAKWWLALPLAVCGYFVNGYILHFLPDFSVLVIALACCSPLLVNILLPRAKIESFSTKRPKWILWFQVLSGAVLVYAITEAARMLGPQWSGTMTCFPIMIIALAPFAHVASGVYATIVVMRGLAAGWIGTALFGCTVILMVRHYHIALVYTLASVIACTGSVLYSLLYLHLQKKIQSVSA